MAESKLTTSLKKEFLSCSICYEDFKNPVALNCLHTFCCKCLSSYAKSINIGPSQILNCPVCRAPMKLPKDGAEGLRKNHWIKNLVELVKDTVLSPASCKMCTDGAPSVIRCLDCSTGLCQQCKEMHLRWIAFQKHRLVTNEELKEGRFLEEWKATPVLCDHHKVMPKDLYCKEKSCLHSICMKCKVLNHEGHKTIAVEEQVREDRNILENLAKNLEVVENGIEVEMKKGKNSKQTIDANENMIVSSIKHRGNNLKIMIQNEIDKLVAEAKDKHLKQRIEANSLLSSLEEKQQKIKTALLIIRNIFEHSTYEDIMCIAAHVAEEFSELEHCNKEVIKWDKWKPPTFRKVETTEDTFEKFIGTVEYQEVQHFDLNPKEALLLPDATILVTGAQGIQKETLQMLLENRSTLDGGQVKYFTITEKGDALVTFQNPAVAHRILAKKKLDFSGKTLQVHHVPDDYLRHINDIATVFVQIPDSYITEDILKLLFSNNRRSGGGPVQNVVLYSEVGLGLVTFEQPEVAERVIHFGDIKLRGNVIKAYPMTLDSLEVLSAALTSCNNAV